MKITQLTNLYVGHNKEENFTVLICALDEEEAADIARQYKVDSLMKGNFEITEFTHTDITFDCDYVLTYCHK